MSNFSTQNAQMSLFKSKEPLAYRIRPKTINEIIGQEHLTCTNGFLNTYVKSGILYSIILWGPPGIGKTTIATLIGLNSGKEFVSLSGAGISVADLREVFNKAKLQPGRVVLFIDEIHRLAKNQQDVLLEPVEKGIIVLIGTTTENPHISLTRALHSRLKVLELKPHLEYDLEKIIHRALSHEDGYPNCKITNEAVKLLVISSSGDARRLLINLEEAVKSTTDQLIDEKLVKTILENTQLQIGIDAENHYNLVSALQKSIRGSDPNAALYWLARLLAGGVDPVQVARRIVVTASEDIGLTDNNALTVALNAYQASQFLGMPEARIPLAQAVIYLACAQKSNTTIISIDQALNDVKTFSPYPVPIHLRNLGGDGYKYPHSFKDAKVEQEYLPKELMNKEYFEPNERDKIKKC